MSRCLEASETRGGNSYKRSIMVIRGKEKKVKNAGKVPLGRANDARFHQGPTEESQASKARFLLFTFPRFSSIAIAFLSDIRAGFVLLCTNVADAISAETRDRQNNKSICSRTIKDLLQLEVESQTSQLGVITDQYPLQIGHRCGHATTGQCVTQTQHVDKPCLECLQPEQATEAGEEQGEQKVAS